MKGHSVFLKLKPELFSITVEEFNAYNMMNEIERILESDMSDSQKHLAIEEAKSKFSNKKNNSITNLKIVKQDFSLMENFYVMKSAFSRHKYVVTSEKVSLISCRNIDFNLTEFQYFYAFSERLGREIIVDGISMIAICKLEDQLITYKNGRYGLLVDSGMHDIRYRGKVNFNPSKTDIETSIINFVQAEKQKKMIRKK